MRHDMSGGILRKFFLLVLLAAFGLVASYLLFPHWWYARFSSWILAEPLKPPKTSAEARASGIRKIHEMSGEKPPVGEKRELSEEEINSVIEEQVSQKKADGSGVAADPNDVAAVLATGISEPQVLIDDGKITIAVNVDLKAFAPYIKAQSGHDLPEEFQKVTPLKAVAAISVENRVLTVKFTSFTLGNVALKNSVLSGMMSDLTEKLELQLRHAMLSPQMPWPFKEISTDEMSCTLPDFIDNVQVQKEKIVIHYRGGTSQTVTAPAAP